MQICVVDFLANSVKQIKLTHIDCYTQNAINHYKRQKNKSTYCFCNKIQLFCIILCFRACLTLTVLCVCSLKPAKNIGEHIANNFVIMVGL